MERVGQTRYRSHLRLGQTSKMCSLKIGFNLSYPPPHKFLRGVLVVFKFIWRKT